MKLAARVVVYGALAAVLVVPGARLRAVTLVSSILSRTGLREDVTLAAARARLEEAIPGIALPLDDARIRIDKSERRLEVFSGERGVRSYPISLGRTPEGAKTTKGDNRTPEGMYFVCGRLDRTRFHLFLGLNYPNAADAKRALAERRIDSAAETGIAEAEKAGRQPDWEGPLGGAVGIHGGGTGSDWTTGCIATENNAIEELWVMTRVGTPVEIVP